MTIEMNRFLALTMALATGAMAATACVVTDDDPADPGNVTDDGGASNQGGSAGDEGVEPVAGAASGGASNAGAAAVAGAVTEGGAAVVAGGAATEGGAAVGTGGAVIEGGAAAVAGATTEGGAAVVGGAATEGGAAVVGGAATEGGAAAVAGAANGGAAGAGGEDECLGDASVELGCYTAMPLTNCAETDPSYEGYYPNPVLEACYGVSTLLGEVQAAIFDCLLTIEDDPCSAEAAAAIAACEQEAIGQACENPLAVTACADGYTDEWDQDHAAILTSCDDGTLDQATCVAALNPRLDYGDVADCMDPNDPSEENYDASFTGDCAARLESCRGY